MKNTEIKEIQEALQSFAQERNWDQFHSPKNLVMALSGEVGELTEVFQWLTPEESEKLSSKQQDKLEEEIADVFLYLVRLADKTGVDLLDVSRKKIAVNAAKYPVEKSYGSAKKYTEL
ncbi:nucleotide pyrophosphohydrolase [Photobacterium sp. DNB22_13_2]